MSQLHADLDHSLPLAASVQQARVEIPGLVEEIVRQVRQEVPAYAGPAHGERGRLITLAVGSAIGQFLDILEGSPANPKVDRLFQQMGRGEAHDGNTLEPMREALHIAHRQCWTHLTEFAAVHHLSAHLLGEIGAAIFGYLDHLDAQVVIGYQGGGPSHVVDHDVARRNLLDALLTDEADTETRHARLEVLAAQAEWPLPDRVVVMRVSFHGSFPDIANAEDVLLRAEESPGVAVCDAVQTDSVARLISRAAPGIRVAVSWPVVPGNAVDAHRWATRALRLVDNGVIPPIPVVNCPDHATQLWLHSEPLLRQRLAQELLTPLLAETPNSREILSETMLAWLESRDSAPAIAAKLGVHPQTVRYRWKRINELFGDLLHDPEFVVTVTMLLKATVPMWKAGHQGDVQHYRASLESP